MLQEDISITGILTVMYLKPSNIYFSQDSILPYFDKRSLFWNYLIGQTLDDICEGRCSISDIPTISVVWKNGKWFTADNRRLWVFRNLERQGKCTTIPVRETYFIPSEKFTTFNGGESVRVRGDPGGHWNSRSPFYLPDFSRNDFTQRYNQSYIESSDTQRPSNFCICVGVSFVIALIVFITAKLW